MKKMRRNYSKKVYKRWLKDKNNELKETRDFVKMNSSQPKKRSNSAFKSTEKKERKNSFMMRS